MSSIGDKLRAQGLNVREYGSAAQIRRDIKTGELDGEEGEEYLQHFSPGEKVGEMYKRIKAKKIQRSAEDLEKLKPVGDPGGRVRG